MMGTQAAPEQFFYDFVWKTMSLTIIFCAGSIPFSI
jgi:hypothetical protein